MQRNIEAQLMQVYRYCTPNPSGTTCDYRNFIHSALLGATNFRTELTAQESALINSPPNQAPIRHEILRALVPAVALWQWVRLRL